MSIDGAHLGVTPQRALKTILGGEPTPAPDEQKTREQMLTELEKIDDDYAKAAVSYDGCALWLAKWMYRLRKEGGSELFKQLKRMMGMTRPVVVMKLRPEHLLEYKERRRAKLKKGEEGKLLMAKLQAVSADLDVMNAELWAWIYREYNLPSDQQYKIDKDGVITKLIDKTEDA